MSQKYEILNKNFTIVQNLFDRYMLNLIKLYFTYNETVKTQYTEVWEKYPMPVYNACSRVYMHYIQVVRNSWYKSITGKSGKRNF